MFRKRGKIPGLPTASPAKERRLQVRDYVGYWLECHNRNCGFPIRVAYSPTPAKGRGKAASLLFACPVCLQVKSYEGKDFRRIHFRTPDPYKAGRLVLYSVHFGCGHGQCPTGVTVFTVAARKVSTAVLLHLWKNWKVNLRCKQHRFAMSDSRTWWIQEEKALAR